MEPIKCEDITECCANYLGNTQSFGMPKLQIRTTTF